MTVAYDEVLAGVPRVAYRHSSFCACCLTGQENLANAKVSARQQRVYEGA